MLFGPMHLTKDDLTPNPQIESSFDAKVTFQGVELPLTLDPDNQTIEDTLALANKVLTDLPGYVERAKDAVVEEFLEN
ncbi:MAG TPA: hypothetical protein DCE41_36440 [Cytophagales bacterium]|nr:hypothetical protein [Cytophagales bacterium]HAA17289.1 hypothetical protein [Cytophagales bacterium]HAP59916.1 hypothetical protein [Cytophagales bacterium]